MALVIYRHNGKSKYSRDWTIIILLYAMIGFMLLSASLAVQNYVLTGHQCKEGTSNDGTTLEGHTP